MAYTYKPTPLMLPASHYDKRRADFAVNFISMLKHTTGEWYGKPFRLMPWQEQIIRDVFGIVGEDGYRQFRTAYVEVGKKNGKEVSLDTPIPTPAGFTTMGEIAVGDMVFDESGKPCQVVGKSAIDYSEQAYRITFKDGEVVEAGENHQWYGEWRSNNKQVDGVVNTRWLYKRSLAPCRKNSIRFRIPINGVLATPEADLPVAPYLMGYWLGNGSATECRITIQTCDASEVISQISPYHEVNRVWKNVGDSIHAYIPDLKRILVKSFHDKVIPIEYLRSSREQRLLLLQGLMDSDGCIGNRKGQGIYCSTEKPLADNVSELLWTLGIKNAVTSDHCTQRTDWTKPSKECGRVPTGETVYMVKFTAFNDVRVAGLARKQSRAVQRNPNSRSHFRYIDTIEPIPNRGMQCIQVDSKSHQYLIGRSCLPTHNSELAAAIALYLLFADGEAGAEVYSCAADINQASIVFNTARAMVEQCPDLLRLSKLVPSTKRIIFPHTNSFYRVLSSETKSKQGFNVSGLIFDELFAQQTRELFDTMTKYTGDARRQPLYFLITTAGRDKTSICYEIHSKAKAVLDGSKVDPSFYPAVFGIEEGDDWEDEKVWRRVNPSIGVTISFETVQAAYEQAKQNPAEEMHFRQFRLNEWCNADIRWMPMDKWDACGEELNPEDYEGRDCYCGLDLSSTGDLTALVLVFPPGPGETKYTVMPFYWLPEDVIDLRTRRDHVPYAVWKKAGVFNTTEGNVVDYDYIVAFIAKLSERFRIREIAYDRYGAEKIRRDLEELGAEHGFVVFPFGQGFISMSPPSKDFYQFVMEGRIRHGKHPVLDWNMRNVIIDQDAAGNIKPNKKKSTEKIDGVVALIMGLARATIGRDDTESVYSRRGLIIL
ncbi:terminase large subunit [Eubacteriales bacterium OttesenSCG-928-A19]|nr:terminase large subunit [Eubacteriales bacterium OttesenSCG-928-A19]